MKLSCVMPTYNNVAFLQSSIDSILNQSLKDLELIVVDDASTDYTQELLEFYKAKDKRFSFYTMERRLGAAVCRNFGNNKAKSDIIMVSDSGDVSHKHRAKATYDFFNKNSDIDIYSSACVEVDALDNQVRVNEPKPFNDSDKPSLFHPTVAYRKSVTDCIKYREGNIYTDQYEVFFLEAFKEGFNFGFSNDFWVKKLIQNNREEGALEARYIQRVKNYKEFGIEVPHHLKQYENK